MKRHYGLTDGQTLFSASMKEEMKRNSEDNKLLKNSLGDMDSTKKPDGQHLLEMRGVSKLVRFTYFLCICRSQPIRIWDNSWSIPTCTYYRMYVAGPFRPCHRQVLASWGNDDSIQALFLKENHHRDAFSHIYKRVCPSVHPSIGYKRLWIMKKRKKKKKLKRNEMIQTTFN